MTKLMFALLFLPLLVKGQATHTEDEKKSDDLRSRYDVALNLYRAGQRDFNVMPWLAQTARLMKKRKLADSIGLDYITSYLSKLKSMAFLTRDNVIFFVNFNNRSDNRAFRILFRHSKTIDKIMKQSGYARNYIDYIIAKDEIDPHFYENGKLVKDIDWSVIQTKIKKKYNSDYANRTIINAKVRWYYNFGHSDTAEILRCLVEKMEKYGLDTAERYRGTTNNLLYGVIFRHSTDLHTIKESVKWAKFIVEKEPSNAYFADTYANLLYKSGKRDQAIREEETAVKLESDGQEIANNLQKMRNGQPTWGE
jgi:hypothetical protein